MTSSSTQDMTSSSTEILATNTVLLLHMDGTNGSTDFPDESDSLHSTAANGDAQVSTSNKKFGTGSMLLDGAGDYLSVADSSDFHISTKQFTIECFIRLDVLPSSLSTRIMYKETNDQNALMFCIDASQGLTFRVDVSNSPQVNIKQGSTSGWAIDTWYHVAVTRDASDDIRVFRDGVVLASGNNSYDIPQFTNDVAIGSWPSVGVYMDGYVDEFRWIDGVAAYTGAFSPPTGPFE
jgi:hypothetical protein